MHSEKPLGKAGNSAYKTVAFYVLCIGFVGKQPVKLHFLNINVFFSYSNT